MKRRSMLMCLALALSIATAIGGTLAYLTDTETTTNVMTVGNVDIKMTEWQRKDQAQNVIEGNVVVFNNDDMELYPSVEVSDEFKYQDYELGPDNQDGLKLWTTEEVLGAVDKMVKVENVGSSSAYFRTLVAVEQLPDMERLHLNWNHKDYIVFRIDNVGGGVPLLFGHEGKTYEMYVAVYKKQLAPGETAPYSLLQVALDGKATNETLTGIEDGYTILVATQAVQTTNFEQLVDNDPGRINEEVLNRVFDLPHYNNPWADAKTDSVADFGTTASGEPANFGCGSESGEPIIVDGSSLVATTYQDLWISDDLTINGGTFVEGLRINVARDSEPLTVTIKGATIKAVSQEALKAAGYTDERIGNQSREAMCFDIEPNGVAVKLVIEDCVFDGESDGTKSRASLYQTNGQYKNAGRGIGLGEMAGNINGMVSATIKNNTFKNIRDHAIQMYGNTTAAAEAQMTVTIQNNRFLSWGKCLEKTGSAINGTKTAGMTLDISGNVYDAEEMTIADNIKLVNIDGYTPMDNEISAEK